MKKVIAIAVLMAALAGQAYCLEVGDKAPPFTLRDANHNLIFLDNFLKKDKVKELVIVFFATWCKPCQGEIPIIMKFKDAWKESGVRVVYVGFRQDTDLLGPFAQEKGMDVTMLGDKYGMTAKRYGVNSIPFLFVLDGSGVVRYKVVGAIENLEEVLNAETKKIIGGAPAKGAQELTPAPKAATRVAKAVISFGRAPSVEKGSSQNPWKDLEEYIAEKSDADVKRVSGDKPQTFMASLKGEKLDVAAVGPMQYMEVKDKYEPVAKLIRNDREFYYGIIFTRKDSGIKDIAGLKGKRIALVSKDSTSGYVYPVLKLYQSGLKLGTDYKGYFLNFHDAVASAVLDKKFDAGACFEDCRDTAMKDDSEKDAKTVVLAYTDEIPSEPIIVKKSLPLELKERIRKAFLDLKAEKGLLKKISEGETEITGFEPVSEADYKGLDEALAQIKSFEKK